MKHLRIMSCAIFLTIGELSYSAQNRHALTDMEQVALAEREIESDRAENLDTKSAYINYIIRKFPQYEEAFNIIIQNRKLPENQDDASILTKKRILPQGQEIISTSKTNQSPFERFLSKYIPENIEDFDAPKLILQIENTIAAAMRPTVMAAIQKYNPNFIHNFDISSVHTMKDLSPTKPFDNIIHDPNPIIQYVRKYSDTKLQSTTPGMQSNSAFMQPIINAWIRKWIIATPDEQAGKYTLLHKAIYQPYNKELGRIDRINLINLLIKAKVKINATDAYGKTALMIAVEYNKIEFITLLIEAGADVNLKDIYGKTALMKTVANRGNKIDESISADIAQLLIAAHADLDAIDANGTTALIDAVIQQRKKIVRLLIDNGANLDIRDDIKFNGGSKRTALMYAILHHDSEIEKMLIDKGADITIQDQSGYTAADYATLPHTALFDLLPLQQPA